MGIRVSQHQFDTICSQMEREFGKIYKGEENAHMMMLFPIEANLLKTYWANPSSNSRRLLEAIPLALLQIKSYLTGEEYELGRFESEDNKRLVHAALMAFDPFTNKEIRGIVEGAFDLNDKEKLRDFYQEPIICLIRIKDSAEYWIKEMGSNGYFDFTEGIMGSSVSRDEEMKQAVNVPEKKGIINKILSLGRRS